VATIDKPSNHHGKVRPDKKYSVVFWDDFFETAKPIASTKTKKKIIIPLSIKLNSITL
jgi:hypothetical protein